MSNQVIIQNAVKRYGDFTALNGVSLDIQEGEFFTLLGPSGCGKTTLLRMIAGFNSIEGGDFYFGEKRINDVPAHKRDIGMVFQNYAIFPHLTVRENVAYGLKARKMPAKEIKPKVDEALELVQISHLADRKPNELSGGQQQRVALARAFVIEPSVLLMDEPLSNLDAKLRVQMRSVIKKLQRRLGITTIYVTHDQEEALAISDRIAVMKDGHIMQIGTPRDIYAKPQNPFVAGFIGVSNFLDCEVNAPTRRKRRREHQGRAGHHRPRLPRLHRKRQNFRPSRAAFLLRERYARHHPVLHLPWRFHRVRGAAERRPEPDRQRVHQGHHRDPQRRRAGSPEL